MVIPKRFLSGWVIAFAFFGTGCTTSNTMTTHNMEITSPAFGQNQSIPKKFTCDGDNINPALEFSGLPKGALSLVLIMEDPDVPKNLRADGMWDHWVVYDMPPSTVEIRENSTPPGTIGINTGGKVAYGGPCPPDREHRYFFKLFALDQMLGLPAGATKQQVLDSMKGHVIGQSELVGRYIR